jgi:hypothetical protein
MTRIARMLNQRREKSEKINLTRRRLFVPLLKHEVE